MKALALFTKSHKLELIDVPEPELKSSKQVKLQVLKVGICGTDREEACGDRGDPPQGEDRLIIGHEMIGRVVEAGNDVQKVKKGDLAVFTVRRGCGQCAPCQNNRADMCLTGNYKERGIKELNGYQAEYVVDEERYIVKVPEAIATWGVLTEPMSVVEKAIDEATLIQEARFGQSGWLKGKQVLVAGLGPIGLLASVVLSIRGAKVIGLDIVDESTTRPSLLKKMGGRYVDGRKVKTAEIGNIFGQIDLILEATGIASIDFDLLETLGTNGVCVLTGIPGGDRSISIPGAEIMQHLVLNNQVMVGSVNASDKHFQYAVDDLTEASKKWPGLLDEIFTSKIPIKEASKRLKDHSANEIKAIVEWEE